MTDVAALARQIRALEEMAHGMRSFLDAATADGPLTPGLASMLEKVMSVEAGIVAKRRQLARICRADPLLYAERLEALLTYTGGSP